MTAIAYRSGVMAADTATAGEDFTRGHVRKIARSRLGTIGAAAGLAGRAAEFRRWIESGRIDEWIASEFAVPLAINEDRNMFGAIIATAAGRVICLDYKGFAVELEAPFYVEGSAEVLMMGAMAAGASAEEAVAIAIKYDRGCGGSVQVERIG